VLIHLLDSVQGQPLQSWQFFDRNAIAIGRDEGNDVVIAHPQVSRAHAQLTLHNGTWTLISTGRHGTIVNDHIVHEFILQHQTIFQLGSGGPMFRFDSELPSLRHSETMENIDPDSIAMLAVDEARKRQEVDQIAGDALFRELQEQSRQFRKAAGPPQDLGGTDPKPFPR
jgi:pSer/pThr/pTyr-binding forkhead associated (FHA) protein